MFEKRVLNIYSIVIGVFFIISGLGKVADTTGFSFLIYKYGLEPLMILSPVLVIMEILLGLCLVLLIYPKQSSLASMILLVIFSCAFAYAHFAKGVNDCGCFGTVRHSSMPPLLSFFRNFLLILMSLLVWVKYPVQKAKIHTWKKWVVAGIMGVSIFIAGQTFILPSGFFKREEPKFQNKPLKNTAFTQYVHTSADSSYLLFCFSYSCPHCWNSIENLRQFIKSNTVDSVVVFATGKPKDKLFFENNFHPDFKIYELAYDSMIKLTSAFPTAYYVINDTIKYVIPSVLPSYITFREEYLPKKQ